MRILVVDQATINTAYNIIEIDDNKKVKWICCSMIKIKSTEDTIKRIKDLYDGLSDIIDEYNIDKIVLEEVPVSRKTNLHTTVVLLKLLGIMEFLAINKNIKIEIMNVNAWKKKAGIVSRTRAEQKKESIQLALSRWKPYREILTNNDDVADSLNMGYAFLKFHNYL